MEKENELQNSHSLLSLNSIFLCQCWRQTSGLDGHWSDIEVCLTLVLLALCSGEQARCVNWVFSSLMVKILVSVNTICTVSQD